MKNSENRSTIKKRNPVPSNWFS